MVDYVWFIPSFMAPVLRSIGLEPNGIRSIPRRQAIKALSYQVCKLSMVGSPYSPLRTKAKLGDWLGLFHRYPHLQDAHTNRARPYSTPLTLPPSDAGSVSSKTAGQPTQLSNEDIM